VTIGPELEKLLTALKSDRYLFPYLRTVRSCDRATEFKQRCLRLGIEGVTLHSYRYSWAERAKKSGYPERWAQVALRHNSRAMAQYYSKGAELVLPLLETWRADPNKVVAVEFRPAADQDQMSAPPLDKSPPSRDSNGDFVSSRRRAPIIVRGFFVLGVPVLPVLCQMFCRLFKPFQVSGFLHDIGSGKHFHSILWWVTERLQKSAFDQDRDMVAVPAKDRRRLIYVEISRQSPQIQECRHCGRN
jgi:hypothetical protein